jgi:benzoylsuccinyl-CoA thiolase BbsA subunit
MIGYVDLPEDVRLFGQIEGEATELQVGAAVEVILGVVRVTDEGEPIIGYKFRLRRAENGA